MDYSTSLPLNQTLYVSNIEDKIKTKGIKKILYEVFSQFGKILDVLVIKKLSLRGQAWIIFADILSATNALQGMQAFPILGKPIRIQYAKTKSTLISKIDGTIDDETFKNLTTLTKKRLKDTDKTSSDLEAKSIQINSNQLENSENKILFVENLPPATTPEMMTMLFQQFTGFLEARMVSSKPGIAFIRFKTEAYASLAKSGTNNFRI